ncbi:type II secretion system protein GspK [uncultured Thiohalocapsa sp.]|uniref:general secretion pathway protein GspK n=1 Tax=uncultured Thiohalocapsa sp. TaxID=768990 RepID=UPI0025DFB03B|nr:type II secretion system protein GspK [uncultured Thiohalocapsa sp.]
MGADGAAQGPGRRLAAVLRHRPGTDIGAQVHARAPSRRARRRARVHQRGIALVLVLWIIALLTIMALGLTTTQRTETALTRNQIDAARFRAHAQSALALTALNLLSTPMEATDPGAVWLPNGAPRALSIDGVELTVTLSNEASRIDLNAATQDQLATLIELAQGEQGFDASRRDALADAIVDWRDEDNLTQLNGAEDDDYDAAGLPYGAGDGPFNSVEELRQVLGMTRELYQRMAQHLTVHNATGRVEERFAAPEVLAAIQGIALEDAVDMVTRRDQPLFEDSQQTQFGDRGGPLYRVRVSSANAGGGRHMEALLLIERGGPSSYEVLWRRFGLLAPASDPTAAAAAGR